MVSVKLPTGKSSPIKSLTIKRPLGEFRHLPHRKIPPPPQRSPTWNIPTQVLNNSTRVF